MTWYAFDSGKSIGQRGSESGIIIRPRWAVDRFMKLEHRCCRPRSLSAAVPELDRQTAEMTQVIRCH